MDLRFDMTVSNLEATAIRSKSNLIGTQSYLSVVAELAPQSASAPKFRTAGQVTKRTCFSARNIKTSVNMDAEFGRYPALGPDRCLDQFIAFLAPAAYRQQTLKTV